jgi:hypothetical protein
MYILSLEKNDCTRATLGLDNSLRYRRSHFTSNRQALSFRYLPSSARPSGQGWIPKEPQDAWLQIKLPSEKILCGVVVSGDKRGQRWVTKYVVGVSRNCMEYSYVTEMDDYMVELTKVCFLL